MRSPWLLLAPALLWLAIFCAAPMLIIGGGAWAKRGDAAQHEAPIVWQMESRAWEKLAEGGFARRLDDEGLSRWENVALAVFSRTLWISIGTTLACLCLGYPVAYCIVRQGPRLRTLLYGLVMIPLLANSIILVYAWTTLLRRGGLLEQALQAVGLLAEDASITILGTPWAVFIGMAYWYLPFLIYPVYSSMEKMDWRLMEAAADLGAGRLRQFWHVLLPQTWPGLATGSLLVFIQAMGTFLFADRLGGAKSLMLGTLIQSKFLSYPENYPLGCALSLATMAALSLGLWAVLRLQTRTE
jgi:spermidine/putrescine transport system permease protein